MEDRHKRVFELDVFFHATREAVQELKDTGYVVNHAGSADSDPRIVIPAHNGKKEDFASLKECSDELLEKLYKNQG